MSQNSVLRVSSDTQCCPWLIPGRGGWAKEAPLPAPALHTQYWLAPQSCLFQLAAPVTAHLVSPGGSMKWKFMFKFKNNILTLGASDVYIFNNLLRTKAWMSGCVSSCLCVTRVCFMGCTLRLFMWVSTAVLPASGSISVNVGVERQHLFWSAVCFSLWFRLCWVCWRAFI